jgi:hypothetical protein
LFFGGRAGFRKRVALGINLNITHKPFSGSERVIRKHLSKVVRTQKTESLARRISSQNLLPALSNFPLLASD